MLMALYSQCCPYVGVSRSSGLLPPTFLNLYFSTSEGLLSMHATASCFTVTPGSFPVQPLSFIVGQGAAPLNELEFKGKIHLQVLHTRS